MTDYQTNTNVTYTYPFTYEAIEGNDTDYLLETKYEDSLDYFDDNDF